MKRAHGSALVALVVIICFAFTAIAIEAKLDFVALLPAMLALLVAVATRRILLALTVGGLCGAVIIASGDWPRAGTDWLTRHVLGSLSGSDWKLIVVFVTLLMGGYAALLERSGSLEVLFVRLSKNGRGRRSIEGASFFAGLVCFFDGLANSLVVGRVMRQAYDVAGLPRERLAYIADSTASPVACVALASTWIAYQLAMIAEGAGLAGKDVSAYALYLAAWPGMFYCWASLLCVALFVFSGWNLGPIGVLQPHVPEISDPGERLASGGQPGVWRVVVPIVVLLAAMIGGLYLDGLSVLRSRQESQLGFVQAIGAADAGKVLLIATITGCVAAFFCYPGKGPNRAGEVFLSGAQGMIYPVAILLLAWALGSTLKELGAATYVAENLSRGFFLSLLPAGVFLISCVTSFSTGTSWGTMGVVMPVALPVAITASGGADPMGSHLPAATVAAVMSGAVFGDHCSPVSDTTIVSATAAGCDPWSHVVTQLPYALIAAGFALFLGFIPWGLGFPVWLCLLLVLLGIVAVRFFSASKIFQRP